MASTRINSVDLGPIWFQSGNGIPDHLAYLGTQYTDLNSALIYSNIDGFNTWSSLAPSSVLTGYQPFITSSLVTDYYRGDKTFQPLTTGVVTEVTDKHYVTDLDLVHLSGLSGINSGDNAVNLTSNAYADAKVQDVIVDGVSGIAPSQNVVYDKLLLKQNLPTGFISGLPLSIKPLDNTKAIIGNGTYAITDFSVLSAITVQLVSVTTPIEFSPAFLLTNPASYVALDINQNVIQSASPFTNEDRRTLALVGAVIHSNNININTTNEIKAPIVAPTNQLHDMIKAVGALNLEGNIYSPNGANLQLNKSNGVIWGLGINASDFYNPHVLSLSAQTAFSFNYRLRNSFQYSGTTSIDPNNYDNGGVLTVVPNNRYTIQRINLFQSGISILQYGQNVYQTLDEAKTFLSTEPFVTEQNIGDNAIFRAYLVIKKGVTNLTTAVSSNDAFFVPVDKFGNVVGGGSLSTLQSAYDNSLSPEIVTNSSLGALSVRNGAGTPNSGTTLFEGLSSGGTVSSRIFADGHVTFSGSVSGASFIKSGGTSAQFLKADGSVDTNPAQIRLSASTDISTITLDSSGIGQNGRNTIIDNTTGITLSTNISSESNFVGSYLKHGASTVTFSAGTGTSIIQLNATLLMNGGAGSRATLTRVDNSFYLSINNV